MSHRKIVVVLALSMALGVAVAQAAPAHARAKGKGLASQAKVSMKTARATALAKVPGGKIHAAELEREKGVLIYSFDIRVPGKPGIEEVQVDAMSDSVVSMTHEDAKTERKEAAQEKQEAQKGTPAAKAKTTGH